MGARPMLYRAGRVIVVSLTAAALIGLCGSCASGSNGHAAEYCAIMPDSVGLYVNNPVTQMGYKVGKVTAITPDTLSVRVDFRVDERRLLPKDVKAVIRSTSILADRSLELVGNHDSGPQLSAGACIPLGNSFTQKSLSQVIGSANDFVNTVNPRGSTNIGDALAGIDKSLRNDGPDINKLLTTTSALLDSPDQAIGDISSIVKNLAQFTSMLSDNYPTIKQVVEDAAAAGPGVAAAGWGAAALAWGIPPLIVLVADLETEVGGELQQTLDATSVLVRKLAGRAPYYASLLNASPRLITGIANFVQSRQNSGFAAFTIRYRPPLYRIRTPDGAFQCGYMNAAVPGSCANIAGMPHAVDVALLQYVLTLAAKR